ncbi:DapH/DapD/GlmU-related protein [Luedemannella flava]
MGRGARVGANVTILPGVRIGAGALIGAGAVVTRDVPDGAVAVGVPARHVGDVDQLGCPAGLDHQPYQFPHQQARHDACQGGHHVYSAG